MEGLHEEDLNNSQEEQGRFTVEEEQPEQDYKTLYVQPPMFPQNLV